MATTRTLMPPTDFPAAKWLPWSRVGDMPPTRHGEQFLVAAPDPTQTGGWRYEVLRWDISVGWTLNGAWVHIPMPYTHYAPLTPR